MNNLCIRWPAASVVCIASGPSLTAEDLEFVRIKHQDGKCRVIVVNREFEFAPWADVCYMADYYCWRQYHAEYKSTFKGEGWTVDKMAAKQFKLKFLNRGFTSGYSTVPNTLNTGGNSGFQAIHLAAYFGASRIIMLGYDMQRTDGREHHYGKHAGKLANGKGFAEWIPALKPLLHDLKKYGLDIVNATRVTAIPDSWARRVPLEEIKWDS